MPAMDLYCTDRKPGMVCHSGILFHALLSSPPIRPPSGCPCYCFYLIESLLFPFFVFSALVQCHVSYPEHTTSLHSSVDPADPPQETQCSLLYQLFYKNVFYYWETDSQNTPLQVFLTALSLLLASCWIYTITTLTDFWPWRPINIGLKDAILIKQMLLWAAELMKLPSLWLHIQRLSCSPSLACPPPLLQ